MLRVIRENGETIDHLLRRYSEGLKRLNFFNVVKSRSAKTRKISKKQKKSSALYKLHKQEKMEYLKRMGRIEETTFGRGSYYKNRGRKAK
jgi:hypothetical protein